MKRKISIFICTLIFLSVNFGQGISNYKVKAYGAENLTSKVYFNQSLTYKSSSTKYINNTDPAYAAIYNAIKNVDSSVDLTQYNLTSTDDVWSRLNSVLEDYPELFYLSYNGLLLYTQYTSTGIICTNLSLTYSYTKDECLNKLSTLENKVNSIIGRITTPAMTDLQKEINIHDYIVQNTTYDYDNYLNGNIPDDDYNVWGILINGTGVCDGYSKALKLLLNRVGIECTRVMSAEMNHAWDIVKIGGDYYHVDATWDDPVPETNRVSYYYFNLTDDEISDSTHNHQWDRTKYPACNSTNYDYLMKLGDSYNYYRVNDSIYYFLSNGLSSMNLDGTNNRVINSNIGGYYPLIFGQDLYFANRFDWNKLYELDLNNGTAVQILDSQIYNLYLKDGILHASTSSDNSTPEFTLALVQKEDLNEDGAVNIDDLALLAQAYNKSKADLGSNWDERLDLNNDGLIDIYDLVPVSRAITLN